MNSKRFLALLMVLATVFALCACGGGEDTPQAPADDVEPAPQAPAEETEAPVKETEAQPTGLQYTVTVTDEGGNAIANAMVQMCEGTNCVPAKTDENGVALFTVQAEADYEVKFMALPAGYEYTTEEEVFHFAAGSKEMTIVLKAVA